MKLIGLKMEELPGIAYNVAANVYKILADLFTALINSGYNWAASYIVQVYNGLVETAANLLVQAMEFIGNIIAGFMRPGSPPKEGPLSTIDKWGAGIMNTFYGSFKDGDFGLIQSALTPVKQAMIDGFGSGAKEAFGIVADDFSELLAQINEGSSLDEDLFGNISDVLGKDNEALTELLRTTLELEEARRNLSDAESEIAAAEKSGFVSQSLRDKLKSAENEVSAAEKRNKMQQEYISLQDFLTNGFDQQQAAIASGALGAAKIGSSMKSALGTVGELSNKIKGIEFDGIAEGIGKALNPGVVQDFSGELGKLEGFADKLNAGFGEGGVTLGELFTDKFFTTAESTIGESYGRLYRAYFDLANNVKDSIFTAIESFLGEDLYAVLQEALQKIPQLLSDDEGVLALWYQAGVLAKQRFVDGISALATQIEEIFSTETALTPFLMEMDTFFSTQFGDVLWTAIKDAVASIPGQLRGEGGAASAWAAVAEEIINGLASALSSLQGSLDEFFDTNFGIKIFSRENIDLGNVFIAKIGELKSLFGLVVDGLIYFRDTLFQAKDAYTEFVNATPESEGIFAALKRLGESLGDLIRVILNELVPAMAGLFGRSQEDGSALMVIAQSTIGLLAVAVDGLAAFLSSLVYPIIGIIDTIAGAIEVIAGLGGAIAALVQGDMTAFAESLGTVRDGLFAMSSGIVETFSGVLIAVTNVFASIVENISGYFGSTLLAQGNEYWGNFFLGMSEAASNIPGILEEVFNDMVAFFVESKEEVTEVWGGIYDNAVKIKELIVGDFEEMSDLVVLGFQVIGEEWEAMTQSLYDTVAPIVEGIEYLFTSMGDAVGNVFGGMYDSFAENFSGLTDLLPESLAGFVGFGEDVGKEVGSAVDSTSKNVAAGAAPLKDAIYLPIITAKDDSIAAVQEMDDVLVGNSIIPDMATSILDVMTNMQEDLIQIFTFLKEKSISLFEEMRNKIIAALKKIENAFSSLRSKAKSALSAIRSSFNKARSAADKLREAVNSLKGAFNDLETVDLAFLETSMQTVAENTEWAAKEARKYKKELEGALSAAERLAKLGGAGQDPGGGSPGGGGTPMAGGMWKVPYDNLRALLHKDEMVVPAELSIPLRELLSSREGIGDVTLPPNVVSTSSYSRNFDNSSRNNTTVINFDRGAFAGAFNGITSRRDADGFVDRLNSIISQSEFRGRIGY